MDMWIETIAGSLIKASSVTHVVVRENTVNGTWEVSVSASAAPALFAASADEQQARRIRNSLVITMAAGNPAGGAQVIAVGADSASVSAYALAA